MANLICSHPRYFAYSLNKNCFLLKRAYFLTPFKNVMFNHNRFIKLMLVGLSMPCSFFAIANNVSENEKREYDAPRATGFAQLPAIVENTSADKILGQTVDDLFRDHFISQSHNLLLTKNVEPSLPLNSINEYGSSFNFAALLGNGGIVVWNISALNNAQFPEIPYGKRVVSVTSSDQNFGMLFDDGTVGFCDATKDWSVAQPMLPQGTKAAAIFSNRSAFAILLNTGKLFCWGDQDNGGHTPFLPQGRRVRSIVANDNAFAAILDDDSLQCWGNPACGGLMPLNITGKAVDSVTPSTYAFAARLKDGSVQCWGDPTLGGELPTTFPQNKKIDTIRATTGAFALLFQDGSLRCWGNETVGGATPLLNNGNILSLVSNGSAFTALLEGGTLFSWGDPSSGGVIPQSINGIMTQQHVVLCTSSFYSFTAILANRTAWYWGWRAEEGKMVNLSNKKIISLQASGNAFTALFDDGTIQSWGDPYSGGITPHLAATKVVSLVSNFQGFLALLDNGKLHAWGGHIGSLGEVHLFDQDLNIEIGKNAIALISTLNKVRFYRQDRLTGITIVQNSSVTHGEWQYLECGSEVWKVIPFIENEREAFFIDADSKLRFVPDKNFYGKPVPLSVRLVGLGAEVQTGSYVDVNVHGGTTSYSDEVIPLKIEIKKERGWFWWLPPRGKFL